MRKDQKTYEARTPGMKALQGRYGLLSEEWLKTERQFNIEEAERNKRAILAYQRDEGRKEGLAEGEAKAVRTVAGRMVDAGLSPDLIKRITGLDMGI